MKTTSILIIFLLAVSCNDSLEYDKEKIELEIVEVAKSWNEAWNGDIDIDRMMSLHHKGLQYYWQGKPISYVGLEEVLKKYIIGVETYNNKLFNPVVTVIDRNNAIIGFQLADSLEEARADENAITLVITRVGSEWKIIHIHEG